MTAFVSVVGYLEYLIDCCGPYVRLQVKYRIFLAPYHFFILKHY
jgi:hypothetical protein